MMNMNEIEIGENYLMTDIRNNQKHIFEIIDIDKKSYTVTDSYNKTYIVDIELYKDIKKLIPMMDLLKINNQELVDLLFEIEDCISIIKQNLRYINKVYSLDDLDDFKYMLRLSTNEFIFLSRALRDLLSHE